MPSAAADLWEQEGRTPSRRTDAQPGRRQQERLLGFPGRPATCEGHVLKAPGRRQLLGPLVMVMAYTK